MEKVDDSVTENELGTLREGIKKKYKEYQSIDRDRFPTLVFNTNRVNYEPLRASFEEEFYVVRGIDRKENNLHIPSTKTLAMIFSDDSYVPSRKIFHTCRSYAESKPKTVIHPALSTVAPSKTAMPAKTRRLILAGIIIVASITIYTTINQLRPAQPASDLVIYRPYQRQIVPRRPFVTGKVSNADTVWIAVWPVGQDKYYIQPPIKVNKDGTWRGQIYVGNGDKRIIGQTFQIRAFVNPGEVFKVIEDYEKDIFYTWPKAQLSTKAIEVVRGPEND